MLLQESVEYLLENACTEDLELLREYIENAKLLKEAEEYLAEAYSLNEETLVEEFTDGQLAVILEDNGFAVTAENIAALREDVETGAVVIGPEVPDGKGGKDADEEDFDIDNGDINDYAETETAEDLKAAIVESYLELIEE
jgi:hypothetical protein